jgi:preprotein translocase subunit SecE
MAIIDEKDVPQKSEAEPSEVVDPSFADPLAELPAPPGPEDAPANLGALKYVHAAFFATGILIAYLASKLLGAGWTHLTEWPTAVRAVPALVRYSEEERETFTLVGGAVVGTAAVIQAYRKERIRDWADEVATELSRVSWPNREAVLNGTLVVIIASAIATVYVAILDRFWGFLTTLVYGA